MVLLGSSGLIGSALVKIISGSRPLRTVRWSEDPRVSEALAKSLDPKMPTDVILACGVTDPKLAAETIRYSNTEFPQRLMSNCLRLPLVRFISLGTVMENFPEACAANPYLKSKFDLGLWIQALAEKPEYLCRFRHLRLHTIYGGSRELVKPHMFLGQILGALEKNLEFKMSSGDQLREYHHVDDIAEAILGIADQDWNANESALVGVHSGNPVRLADLANAIFSAFGKSDLLKVGRLVRPPGENLQQTFERSARHVLPNAREPIAGVIQWLKEILDVRPR